MNKTQIAKQLGRLGGKARAKKLSSKRRKEIASLGGCARRESIKIAQRIRTNFLYADAVRKLSRTHA